MTKEITKPKTLAEALIEFKKQDIEIFKQSTNPHFKSKYADLATILDAVEKPLADLGVIISSHSHLVGDSWVNTTVLEFGSEKKESSFPLFGAKPQELGSSITYARRFSLQNLLNIAALDDDGNAANNSIKLYTTAAARTAAFNKVKADFMAAESTEELKAAVAEHKEELARLKQSDPQIGDELTKIYSGRQDLLKGLEAQLNA